MIPSPARAEDRMKVTYELPPGVKSFKYEPNTHFVELTDLQGETLHLPATGVMAHQCGTCNLVWWTGTNQCSACPSCLSPNVKRIWGKMQVAFVPEEESKFVPPTQSLMPRAIDGAPILGKTLVPTGEPKG